MFLRLCIENPGAEASGSNGRVPLISDGSLSEHLKWA
jgi:hypothetical protein